MVGKEAIGLVYKLHDIDEKIESLECSRSEAEDALYRLLGVVPRRGAILDFQRWYDENIDELDIGFAESGADREPDFSHDHAIEDAYDEYVLRELQALQT